MHTCVYIYAVGLMPKQLFATFITLLPKATGGLRPIAWAQSVFRVWSRARQALVKAWESACTNHLAFAAQRGKSPIDIIWRQSFKAEAAQEAGDHFVCLFWDLYKCYELINHSKLLLAGRKHNYRMAVLRICIAAYKAPRRILYKGIVSRPILPNCGILAGVSSATSELRLLLMDAALSHIDRHPKVNLNIFIDDLALDTVDSDKTEAIQNISAAAFDLLDQLDRVGLPIAKHKAAVLANASSTAVSLRRLLGDLGGPALGSVMALGLDFLAGQPFEKQNQARQKHQASRLGQKETQAGCPQESGPHCCFQGFYLWHSAGHSI